MSADDTTPAAGAGITEADLHAYVDGWLDAEGRARVAAHLAEHPADRTRVDAWRVQADHLRVLLGGAVDEPVPPRLDVRRMAEGRHAGRRRFALMAASAALLVAFGAAGGWYGRELAGPAPADRAMVAEAEVAHALYTPEVMHPVEVSADQGDHLARWLSKRLARPLALPDLSRAGFSLVGGRLLPAGDGPAAQLMYENREGRRITLYVVPGGGSETAMRVSERDGLTAVSWRGERLGCVLVGDLPRPELMTLAKESYESLDGPEA